MKPRSKSFTCNGIVLRRFNLGETDRVVTLLTQEHGKLVTIAKGVRKLSSSKRAFLEPGNYVSVHLIKTKSLPLLTQAKLVDDCASIRHSLSQIRKLTQFLEILEKLMVEAELSPSLFANILNLRQQIVSRQISNGQIKNQLGDLIEQLGYQHPKLTKYDSILDYVSTLAERPMRSFEYLSVDHAGHHPK